jgi:U1 small nuclear ribonucleoprotein
MPNPPIKQLPPIKSKRRKNPTQGVFQFLDKLEKTPTPKRIIQPTPKTLKKSKAQARSKQLNEQRKSMIDGYRAFQRDCGGEYEGMNCYNTLFVGRLAYEVTEGKLLREMEAFGPVKDIKLVSDKQGKSRGIAFVEYENDEDMKRAYRTADGMKIEGREIVVDVERGHTVPTWLPRRLGGGLGGTRLGGKLQNVKAPGRFDPSRISEAARMQQASMGEPPPSMGGMGRGPPPGGYYDGPPPGGNYGGGGGGGGYGDFSRGGGDRDRRRRRSRSRSPERGRYAPRSRY